MKKATFESNILNGSYEYFILSSAKPQNDAFLLYVQDGQDYLELGELEKAYQRLLETYPNEAQKLIMVLIHPGGSHERWHSYHHNGNSFEAYIQFMYKEFIPEIENRLSVRVAKRGLLGDSLAANISLNIAGRNPGKWTHLLLQSAAISTADIAEVANIKEKLHWTVYQTVGIREDEFISTITRAKLDILTRNRELHHNLIKSGAIVHYKEQNEDHEWMFWKRDLYEALSYFIR